MRLGRHARFTIEAIASIRLYHSRRFSRAFTGRMALGSLRLAPEILRNLFRLKSARAGAMNWREIGVEEAEGVRRLDDAHSGNALLVNNLIAKGLHLRPVHLGPEMMFR